MSWQRLRDSELSESESLAGISKGELAELVREYQTAAVGLCHLDLDLRYVRINEHLAAINGKPVEEHLGRTLRELAPEIADQVEPAYRRAIETGDPALDLEVHGPSPDEPGALRYWSVNYYPVRSADGKVCGVSAVVQDITARKEIEAAHDALRKSEERYRDLYDHAPDMFFSVDADTGKVSQCNQTLLTKTGYSKEQVIGRHLFDLYHPDCGDTVREVFRTFQSSGSIRDAELQLQRSDGSALDVSVNVSAVRDDRGKLIMSRSALRDITRRKRAEQELQASEKALRTSQQFLRTLTGKLLSAQEEERSRLARELHDDITQRLAVLAIDMGVVEQRRDVAGEDVYRKIGKVKEGLVRLSEDMHRICRQLHPSILDDLGLISAIESECTALREREDIDVDYVADRFPEPLPREIALCLYRIFQEGLRNIAKHAGTRSAVVRLERRDGAMHLSIRDDGVGFDIDSVRGKGGLGLAGMKERVRFIEGSFSVESSPGKGTSIQVQVPLKEPR